MSIITTAKLIELGKLATQGLLKYWQDKRHARHLKKAEADSVKRWIRDENRCYDLNAKLRNQTVKQTDYIDLQSQGLKAMREIVEKLDKASR